MGGVHETYYELIFNEPTAFREYFELFDTKSLNDFKVDMV